VQFKTIFQIDNLYAVLRWQFFIVELHAPNGLGDIKQGIWQKVFMPRHSRFCEVSFENYEPRI
jgi:hypothetical protein